MLELNSLMARFWWGSQGDKKTIHWLSWETLCQPKKKGGLNFRSLEDFNRALLAKQGWCLLKDEDSLVAQVFKAKYYQNCSFLEAKLGNGPSQVWGAILWGREILMKGLIWRIGNGRKVKVYEDGWLPRPKTFRVYSPISLNLDTLVADLLFPCLTWNKELINRHFFKEEASLIQNVVIGGQNAEDRLA